LGVGVTSLAISSAPANPLQTSVPLTTAPRVSRPVPGAPAVARKRAFKEWQERERKHKQSLAKWGNQRKRL
jgi:hypothetical protein